jgi:hypothetical protein
MAAGEQAQANSVAEQQQQQEGTVPPSDDDGGGGDPVVPERKWLGAAAAAGGGRWLAPSDHALVRSERERAMASAQVLEALHGWLRRISRVQVQRAIAVPVAATAVGPDAEGWGSAVSAGAARPDPHDGVVQDDAIPAGGWSRKLVLVGDGVRLAGRTTLPPSEWGDGATVEVARAAGVLAALGERREARDLQAAVLAAREARTGRWLLGGARPSSAPLDAGRWKVALRPRTHTHTLYYIYIYIIYICIYMCVL